MVKGRGDPDTERLLDELQDEVADLKAEIKRLKRANRSR